MKKKIMKKWVKALKSGEYRQNYGGLCDTNSFCCLGVLTELFIQEKHKTKLGKYKYGWEGSNYRLLAYKGEDSILHEDILKWSGIKTSDGMYYDDNKYKSTLAIKNDACHSFNEIASIIEKHYEEL